MFELGFFWIWFFFLVICFVCLLFFFNGGINALITKLISEVMVLSVIHNLSEILFADCLN